MGKLQGSRIEEEFPGNRNRELVASGPASLAIGETKSQRTQAPLRGNDDVN